MSKLALGFMLIALVGANSFAGTAVATSRSETGEFELTVVTAVAAESPDGGTCTAVLKNSKTGEVLAAPRIAFKVGETAEASSTDEHSRFTLKLTSDSETNRATARVEYAIMGEVVFAPNVTFELR
jgi:hypothetical protein